MTDDKKQIRRWGESPRSGGTMRDLRSLRQPDPTPEESENKPLPTPSISTISILSPPSNIIPSPPEPPPQIKIVPTPALDSPPTSKTQPLFIDDGSPILSFEDFKIRWKPFLRKGQLKICEALYQKTYAIGQNHCFTSFSELAALTGIKIRQCFNLIAQLESLRFVERTRVARGSDRAKAGSTIYFYLSPKK